MSSGTVLIVAVVVVIVVMFFLYLFVWLTSIGDCANLIKEARYYDAQTKRSGDIYLIHRIRFKYLDVLGESMMVGVAYAIVVALCGTFLLFLPFFDTTTHEGRLAFETNSGYVMNACGIVFILSTIYYYPQILSDYLKKLKVDVGW